MNIPFDFDLLDEIIENGCTVDVSLTDFPGKSKDELYRTTFIYLRNLDIPKLKLDFSKVLYEDKVRYIIEYMWGDIVYNIDELNITWFEILTAFCELSVNSPSGIFSQSELIKFVGEYRDRCNEILQFLKSAPLYIINRLKLDGVRIDMDFKAQTRTSNNNVYNLIKFEYYQELIEYATDKFQMIPSYYEEFNNENDKLFELILSYTTFGPVMYGLMEDAENFKNLLPHLVQLNNEIH